MSSVNQSIRSPMLKMPALLIQPPRLVHVPTSGETVTTRAATSGASRARSTKKRPNAFWVENLPWCLRPRSAGILGAGTARVAPRLSRRAVAAHSSASGEPGSSGANGSSGSSPSFAASSRYCEWFSSAE